VFGRPPGGGPDASVVSGWAGSRVAKPAVAETPSIDLSAACRSAPKLGLDGAFRPRPMQPGTSPRVLAKRGRERSRQNLRSKASNSPCLSTVARLDSYPDTIRSA
jgi:hypothetical protein